MKEILVLCPFGVDKGLLSKAAQLSDGALRVLVPAGESDTAAEYSASRIFALNDTRIVGYGKPNYAAVQQKQQAIK